MKRKIYNSQIPPIARARKNHVFDLISWKKWRAVELPNRMTAVIAAPMEGS